MERLLTLKEACVILGVMPNMIYAYNSKGKGGPPYIRVGNRIRFRESDIEEWLTSRTVTLEIALRYS